MPCICQLQEVNLLVQSASIGHLSSKPPVRQPPLHFSFKICSCIALLKYQAPVTSAGIYRSHPRTHGSTTRNSKRAMKQRCRATPHPWQFSHCVRSPGSRLPQQASRQTLVRRPDPSHGPHACNGRNHGTGEWSNIYSIEHWQMEAFRCLITLSVISVYLILVTCHFLSALFAVRFGDV